MSYLLRKEDGYRLCYGEPKRPYVITSNGGFFCATEYQKMVDEEKEVRAHTLMDGDNFPIDNWADVSENNLGLELSDEIAEYLLEGKELEVNTFCEITASINSTKEVKA